MTAANLASLGRDLAALKVEMYRLGAAAKSFTVDHTSVSVKDFGAVGDGIHDDWPAFKAAHDSFVDPIDPWRGGRIYIPPGKYYLSRTWEISKTMLIVGAGSGYQHTNATTLLIFDAGVCGIRFWDPWRGPGGGTAQQSRIYDVQLLGGTGGDGAGHGIYASCVIFGENLVVQKFSGDGVLFEGNVGTEIGNCNGWSLSNSHLINNDGHGLHLSQADANAGTAFNVQSTSNKGWSFWDDSKLGNNFYACLSEGGVGMGSYKSSVVSQGSVFSGCYVEIGGTFLTDFGVGAQVFGGNLTVEFNSPIIEILGDGSGASAFVTSATAAGDGINQIIIVDGGSGYTWATADVQTRGSPGAGCTLTPVLTGGAVTSITITAAGAGYLQGLRRVTEFVPDGAEGGWRGFRARFMQRKPGTHRAVDLVLAGSADLLIEAHALSSGVPGSTDIVGWNETAKCFESGFNGFQNRGLRYISDLTTTETGGRSAPLTPGSIEFPSGFWVGAGANARFIGTGSAAPVAGEWKRGDRIFNINAGSGNPGGWLCNADGTPGTWETFP